MTGNAIFNLSFDKFVTDQSLAKSTDRIVSSVDKVTSKVSSDIKSNTDKLANIVKSGTEKIAEGIGRLKVTNESNPLGAIYAEVLDAIQKVSTFVSTNSEADPQQIQSINKQLVLMIEAVDSLGEANKLLDYARNNIDWTLRASAGSNYSVAINNACEGMQVFDSFQDVLISQGDKW